MITLKLKHDSPYLARTIYIEAGVPVPRQGEYLWVDEQSRFIVTRVEYFYNSLYMVYVTLTLEKNYD